MNNFQFLAINICYQPSILSIFDIMPIGIQTIKGLLTLRLRQRNCAQEPVKTNRPQPTSLLCTLPIELIEYIAAALDLVDLCLLRLACKNLSQKTIHYFGSTYIPSKSVLASAVAGDPALLTGFSKNGPKQ
jgi:hypothetical protein